MLYTTTSLYNPRFGDHNVHFQFGQLFAFLLDSMVHACYCLNDVKAPQIHVNERNTALNGRQHPDH